MSSVHPLFFLLLPHASLLAILALAPASATAQAQRGFDAQSPSVTATGGRRLVMVIGIDQYKGWPKLNNAANDATGFERELKEKLGFQEVAPPLLNQDATRQAIQHTVDDVLYRELKSNDELVLFFAGHGTTRVDTVGGREVETGFLVPYEARSPGQEEEWSDYIQVDQFLASVGRLPARHILVVLDACHSGFALGHAMESSRGDIRYREDIAARVSRKVITSARRNQSATDGGPIPNHSLFTGMLIDGLDSGAADLDGDGVVTSSELGLYLQQAVGRYSESAQTPDFGSFYLDDRGELLLPITGENAGTGINRKPNSGRRAIALLGFKNLSAREDQAWLSTALAEMLATELGAGDGLRTISGENIARMKRDLSLTDTESLSQDTLGRVYRFLGSDLVVSGSYLDIGGQLRVDVRIQDALSGDTLATLTSSGTETGILDLVGRLGAELRSKCGGAVITDAEAGALLKAQPAHTDALRFYAEGLNQLRDFDARGARQSLEKAVAADPEYAPAHSALAESWKLLGYDQKAKKEAKQAFESSRGLARKDALLIEARYQETSGDWNKASDIYKSLWTFFPDELEYGLYLANSQISAGKGPDVAATLRALRQLPRPMRDDPRIDLADAGAADSVADYKHELEATAQSIEKGKRAGQLLLQAQAFGMRCWAFRNLGDFQSAKEAGTHAQETYSAAGDSLGLARSFTCLGNVANDEGDFQTALQLHKNALALATELGAELDVVGALINLGTVLQSQNDPKEAIANYQRALSTALEIADKGDALLAEDDLGNAFFTQGDFDAAKEMYVRSLGTAEEIGDQGGSVAASVNLGIISYLHGDLPQARTQIEAAATKAQNLGMQTYAALALSASGDVLAAQGENLEAERKYRQSLDICQRVNEKSYAANAELSIAALKLEKDDGSEAEGLAQAALKEFEAERNVNQQTAAHDILAQALIIERKLPEAQIEIDRARGLSAQDQAIILSRSVTSGRLLALTGKYDEAMQELQGAMDRAREMNLIGWQMQSALYLAEAQLRSGNAGPGRAALDLVRKQASERGYLSISRKAATMATSYDSTAHSRATTQN